MTNPPLYHHHHHHHHHHHPITKSQCTHYRNHQKFRAVQMCRKQLFQNPINLLFTRTQSQNHAQNAIITTTTNSHPHEGRPSYHYNPSQPEYIHLTFLTNEIVLASDRNGLLDVVKLPPYLPSNYLRLSKCDSHDNDNDDDFSFHGTNLGTLLAFNLESTPPLIHSYSHPSPNLKLFPFQNGTQFVTGASNGDMTLFDLNYMDSQKTKRADTASFANTICSRWNAPRRKFHRRGLFPQYPPSQRQQQRQRRVHTTSFQSSIPLVKTLIQNGLVVDSLYSIGFEQEQHDSLLIPDWETGYFPPNELLLHSRSSSFLSNNNHLKVPSQPPPPPLLIQPEHLWDFQEQASSVLGVHVDSEQDCFSFLDSRFSISGSNSQRREIHRLGSSKSVLCVDAKAFESDSRNQREDITSVCFHGDHHILTAHVTTTTNTITSNQRNHNPKVTHSNILKKWDKRMISNIHPNPVESFQIPSFPNTTAIPLTCEEECTVQINYSSEPNCGLRRDIVLGSPASTTTQYNRSEKDSLFQSQNPIYQIRSATSKAHSKHQNHLISILVSFSSSQNNPYSEDLLIDSSFSTILASIPKKQQYPTYGDWSFSQNTAIGNTNHDLYRNDCASANCEIPSCITPDHSFLVCANISNGNTQLKFMDLTTSPRISRQKDGNCSSQSDDFGVKKRRTIGGYEFGESNKRRLSLDGTSHDPLGVKQVELMDRDGLPSNLKAMAINDLGTIVVCSNVDGDLFACRGM